MLIPNILASFASLDGVRSVVDLFSGTSRVGHALKRAGYQVFANDINAYAYQLALCYVQANREDWLEEAEARIALLNKLEGRAGFFTESFCERARYFQPKNGMRIDAIRSQIQDWALPDELKSILLVSLIEAADRVDSTTGLQMAFLKQWATRSFRDLELRMPDVLPTGATRPGKAYQLDALEAAKCLSADAAYLDPPYNQHSYLGNYHIWETLVLWDQPELYGVANKREDVRTRQSPFNSRTKFREAFAQVIANLDVRYLVVSFNNEGFLSRAELEEILSTRGDLLIEECDYKRYVGAQIGVYNPQGERVGKTSHLRNREFLFTVRCRPT